MKIYVFSDPTGEWTVEGKAAIVANSQEEALALYRSQDFTDSDGYAVEEYEIRTGLMLLAGGYDRVDIEASYIEPKQPEALPTLCR